MANQSERKIPLAARAVLMTLLGITVLSLFFFLSAGTLNYREAWIYLVILYIPMTGVLVYLLKNDLACWSAA